jgi:hypothetical protein
MEEGGGCIDGAVIGTTTITGATGAGGSRGQGRGRCCEALQLQANCSAKDGVGQGRRANLVAVHDGANCSAKPGAQLGTAASRCTPPGSGRAEMPRKRREAVVGVEAGREG